MTMKSWSRSRKPDSIDGALRLFNIMTGLFRGGVAACRPTRKTFTQLMVVLENNHTHNNNNGRRPGNIMGIADRLLDGMKDYSVEPDRAIWNWYMRVCSSSSIPGENKEVDTAILNQVFKTLDMLRESKQGADSICYLNAILAC